MLNSANYTRDDGVLNVGETIDAEVDMSVPGMKVYYCSIANSVTHMPDGSTICFRGGQFATSNKDIQAFLDKIADKPTTPIYTKQDKFTSQLAGASVDAAVDSSKLTVDNKGIGNAATVQSVETTKAAMQSTGTALKSS